MPQQQQSAAMDAHVCVVSTDNGIPTQAVKSTIVLSVFVTIFDGQPPKEMPLNIWPEKQGSEWLSSHQGNSPAVTVIRHQPEDLVLTTKQARKSSEDTQVAGYARFEKFGPGKLWVTKVLFQNIYINFLAKLDNFKKINFCFFSLIFCISVIFQGDPSPLIRIT